MSGRPVIEAGWYGKIASLGDFASRRLSPGFIARWDRWLQDVLAASRAGMGGAWTGAYLTSAVWRFVEWASDDADGLHAGLMMPSVDRVGRYFPLCVAAVLPRLPADDHDLHQLLDWLDRIEAIALKTLDTRAGVQAFDDAVRATHAPIGAEPAGEPIAAIPLRRIGRAGSPVELSSRSFASMSAGSSVWWVGADRSDDPPLFECRGLPDARRFTAMLRADPAPSG